MKPQAGQVWRRPDGVLFDIETIDNGEARVYARPNAQLVNVIRAVNPGVIPVIVIEQGWRHIAEPELADRGT